MSARTFLDALDAYLDAREEYGRTWTSGDTLERLSYGEGDRRRIERELATARCDLERELGALVGKGTEL